jgi:carbon-monoxide dehydrogenase iron sulfur subunit
MHRTGDDVVTNVGGTQECIACGMCVMMCPFGMIARAHSPDGKVMALKCDLCPDRDVPACVESCPTGAIVYISGDGFSHQSRIRAATVLSQAKSLSETTIAQEMEE